MRPSTNYTWTDDGRVVTNTQIVAGIPVEGNKRQRIEALIFFFSDDIFPSQLYVSRHSDKNKYIYFEFFLFELHTSSLTPLRRGYIPNNPEAFRRNNRLRAR